jgi:glycosyltransferase involved in cell wall biosynthesis
MQRPMIERVVWVLVHPTPYNIYLLNELSRELPVPVSAVYRWAMLPSHPWSDLPHRAFPWRVARPEGTADPELRQLAAGDPRTLMIFAGWRDRTIRPLLVRRWVARLPFAFWMDTPKLTRNPVRKGMNRLLVLAGKRSLGMLATGQPAIDAFVRMGFPRQRVVDFPFVVDPEHFADAVVRREERRASGTDRNVVRFIQCGRLIDSLKGQSVAFRALARAATQEPGIRFELWVSGTGRDEQALRKAAERIGVADRVRFVGWTGYGDLPALFGQCDALVMPSHWDPFPVAVIEAMAAGLPVLGSDACGSVRERVEHGATGWIHPAGDDLSLAAHMLAFARAPDHEGIGFAALDASRSWDIDRCLRAFGSLLNGVSA